MTAPDYISPVVGYRVWRWDATELESLNGVRWRPGEALTFQCKTQSLHEAPHADCTCGIYASKSLDHLRRLGYTQDRFQGEVWLWGTVVEHEDGWRAQFAYPKTLVVPISMVPLGMSSAERWLARLAAYRCDILVLGEIGPVPLWCTCSGVVAEGLNLLVQRCNAWYALYPTKWNYEFADIPVVEHQHTPMFTGEEVTKIIAKTEGQVRLMFILFAASGLRAGELFGLELKHFNANAITVEQSVWENRVQAPKTKSAFRQVDLHPTVAAVLRDFIGDRKEGFIFRTRTGTPFLQSNVLRAFLHPILQELGIEKQGFHSFRRFRVTHLESSYVPSALVKYWTGHAKSSDGEVVQSTVTDKYIKMGKDTKFRADVAERIGLGFELPKAEAVGIVPSVPNSQETEVSVSI